MTTIVLNVLGDPASKGSYTAYKGGIINGRTAGAGRKFAAWKKAVGAAAREAMRHERLREGRRFVWMTDPSKPPLDGPIAVTIVAWYARPKHETRAQRVRCWKISAPDADKIARSTLDPLNEVVIADDARIASLRVEKRYIAYGDVESQPRAEITITQLPDGE